MSLVSITTPPASIEQDRQRLTRNSIRAIAGTLLSRSFGVIRTLVVNACFGANTTLDAFNTAFRFPNSLRDLFADGALSAAFIKVLVDIEPKGREAMQELIAIVSGFFLCVTFLLAMMGAIYAKPIMSAVSGHQFVIRGGLHLATSLFQMLVFYLPLTMLNAIVMAVLGIKGDTFRAMNGSLFLSIGIVVGASILAPFLHMQHISSVFGVAIGAMLGALLQLVYQMYPLLGWRLIALPCINPITWWHYQPLRQILRLMAPRALGQGAFVFALMINTFFALQISAGSITYVTTTVTIIQVPIGLFGVATGFAALPLLSAAYNNRDEALFHHLLRESLRTATWLSVFTLISLSLLIVPLYKIVFQHGRITFHDTIQNSIAICAYGAGIFFASNGKVLTNALYAVNSTRQIIINAFIYLLVNSLLSAWLVPHFGLIGLGFSFTTATAVDCWLNLLVVYRAALKRFARKSEKRLCIIGLFIPFSIASMASYLIGFLGVILCQYVWPNFSVITHVSLNLWWAISLLAVVGSILLLSFILLSRFYGPEQLQHVLKKIY